MSKAFRGLNSGNQITGFYGLNELTSSCCCLACSNNSCCCLCSSSSGTPSRSSRLFPLRRCFWVCERTNWDEGESKRREIIQWKTMAKKCVNARHKILSHIIGIPVSKHKLSWNPEYHNVNLFISSIRMQKQLTLACSLYSLKTSFTSSI